MTASETWRLLITPPLPGARNMAIDQALAELYPVIKQPTLRFYRWSPACLSLGLAQRLHRDVNIAACAERGIDVVRRPTGGRAILHDQEVTYALITGADHPHIDRPSITESYRAISEALCAGLINLGLDPQLAARPPRHARKSAACFDLPGDYEITLGGRKLVGSAQARQRGVVLQHGTILLHADVQLLIDVLRLPDDLIDVTLAERLVALDEALGYRPPFEEVVAALVRGFERHWSINLAPGEMTAAESQRADELMREKFGNPGWTMRR